MYSFVAFDNLGNYYISQLAFETKVKVEEEINRIIEYSFIDSIEIMTCEEINLLFNNTNNFIEVLN